MNANNKVRVMLVDDSLLTLTLLKRIINNDPRLEVVATAFDGIDALERLDACKPDVLCTDYHMPRMNGLELTQRAMREHPLPILVVSVSVQDDKQANVLHLIGAGALDVFPKPLNGVQLNTAEGRALCDRIYLLSKVTAIRRFNRSPASRSSMLASSVAQAPLLQLPPHLNGNNVQRQILAIGGSTGGPQAFATLLSGLSKHFPLPIVCVQHISTGFSASLIDWLNGLSSLSVKAAVNGESLRPGVAYFAPDDTHLVVKGDQVWLDRVSPPVNNSRPSVDKLFESVAEHYGNRAIAVLLSGMGRDGAKGLLAMHERGAYTIAQSEESCVVFGMPAEAARLGAVDMLLNPADMLPILNEQVRNQALFS